jgi:predicted DCC family thiol-disulfide oxidoreductase YuxK
MPAKRLALLRIASGGFMLWYFATRYSLMSDVARSEAENFDPVGLAAWLNAPLPPDLFMGIVWVTMALGVAYMLGWRFRVTGIAFALFGLFVFSYRYSWSMIYHDNIAVVLHVLIIALSPAADAYSLDARHRPSDTIHWCYGWPVRLLCAATALTYFVSGAAKLFGNLGWSWIDGSAMRSQVAVDALRKELMGEAASPLFYWLYAHTELFLLMGLFTFVLELGAPLMLFSKRSRVLWAVSTWSMHWGILLLMGITFRYQLSGLIFLSFFAVEKWWPALQAPWLAWRKSSPLGQQVSAVVLFDGVCNFCNASVRFVAERDRAGVFYFASQQSAAGQTMLREYRSPGDLSSIVLIEDGRTYLYSTAVLRIARHLGGLWPLLYVFIAVPKPMRDAVYKWFARRRYQWLGRMEACPIPSPAIRKRFLE